MFFRRPFADTVSPADMERSRMLSARIHEEVAHSPNGMMTYGQFVNRSMYGYPDAPIGYYTQSDFKPNSHSKNSWDYNSFGTLAVLRGVNEALGTVLASELLQGDRQKSMSFTEIGGGDGIMLEGILKGMVVQFNAASYRTKIHINSIDTTPQLLDRQLERIATVLEKGTNSPLRSFIMSHTSTLGDITDPELTVEKRDFGIVFSNELLDMLPFEVAMKHGDESGILHVGLSKETDGLTYKIAPAPEECEELCAKTITAQASESVTRSFQPGLLDVMDRLSGIVKHGQILTMDYASHQQDVQITRVGAQTSPRDELRFPGLLDISVTPDWGRIVTWAKNNFDTEDIRYQPVLDLVANAPQLKSLDQITGKRMPDDAERRAQFEQLFKQLIDSYDFLLIKK